MAVGNFITMYGAVIVMLLPNKGRRETAHLRFPHLLQRDNKRLRDTMDPHERARTRADLTSLRV